MLTQWEDILNKVGNVVDKENPGEIVWQLGKRNKFSTKSMYQGSKMI